jgi:hypothetical protein
MANYLDVIESLSDELQDSTYLVYIEPKKRIKATYVMWIYS